MKILHLADLHLDHDWFDWVAKAATRYDLLVLAGDLQNAFSRLPLHDQARAVSQWLLALSTPTVVCSGNHDYWVHDPRVVTDTSAEAGWIRNLRGQGKVIGVDGDTIEFGGLRLLVNGWLQVPKPTGPIDIVVSHAPPEGCACAGGKHGEDHGDPELWPALADHPPALILSGHIHTPRALGGRWSPFDPRSLVLVPGCNEQLEIPAHWVIDTRAQLAVHSSEVQHRFSFSR